MMQKHNRHMSFSLYISALAATDTLTLIIGEVYWFKSTIKFPLNLNGVLYSSKETAQSVLKISKSVQGRIIPHTIYQLPLVSALISNHYFYLSGHFALIHIETVSLKNRLQIQNCLFFLGCSLIFRPI